MMPRVFLRTNSCICITWPFDMDKNTQNATLEGAVFFVSDHTHVYQLDPKVLNHLPNLSWHHNM